MRELKFRAWDKKFKKMYFKGLMLCVDGDLGFDPRVFKKGKYAPLEMELMQFTGLHDRKGKEIYEGDILKKHTPSNWIPEGNVVVKYSGNGFWCESKSGGNFFPDVDYVEIIGNIYENPELLKDSK